MKRYPIPLSQSWPGRLLCAAVSVLLVAMLLSPAHAAIKKTGDDDDLSDLQVQRNRPPLPSVRSKANSATAAAASVLLVDDDASDNNNIPGDTRLSTSDQFFRQLLQDRNLSFESFIVPRYESGPGINTLRHYRLVIWYTADSYGGNRDNSAVISLEDEQSLRQYLATGGSVILISPGYLNNALGAGGEAGWEKATWPFLTEVLGLQGGRGLLQRFKAADVTASDGTRFEVAGNRGPETQFSALNPATATPLFTADLAPDAKGSRPVAVAAVNSVGGGRMVYVGFTFENIATNHADAFDRLLLAAGWATQVQMKGAAPSRTINVPAMSLTGSGATAKIQVPAMILRRGAGAGVKFRP